MHYPWDGIWFQILISIGFYKIKTHSFVVQDRTSRIAHTLFFFLFVAWPFPRSWQRGGQCTATKMCGRLALKIQSQYNRRHYEIFCFHFSEKISDFVCSLFSKAILFDFYFTLLQLVLCRVAAVKSLPVHHYSAGYSLFPLGSLSHPGYLENRIPLKPALGGVCSL